MVAVKSSGDITVESVREQKIEGHVTDLNVCNDDRPK